MVVFIVRYLQMLKYHKSSKRPASNKVVIILRREGGNCHTTRNLGSIKPSGSLKPLNNCFRCTVMMARKNMSNKRNWTNWKRNGRFVPSLFFQDMILASFVHFKRVSGGCQGVEDVER